MDNSDKTPIVNYIGSNSQMGLAGFAHFEQAIEFLRKLGLGAEEIHRIPDIALSSFGTLLKQADENQGQLELFSNAYRRERKDNQRLRDQRNQLRAMFQRMGHDPMPGYKSEEVEFELV